MIHTTSISYNHHVSFHDFRSLNFHPTFTIRGTAMTGTRLHYFFVSTLPQLFASPQTYPIFPDLVARLLSKSATTDRLPERRNSKSSCCHTTARPPPWPRLAALSRRYCCGLSRPRSDSDGAFARRCSLPSYTAHVCVCGVSD